MGRNLARQICFMLLLAALTLMGARVRAQQTPPSASPATAQPIAGALNNLLLQQADEDSIPTDLFSRITLKYDHGAFNGQSQNDRLRIAGQQAFGLRNRLSLGYEIPFFVDFRGGPNATSGRGMGDFKIDGSFLLGKTERFSNAVRGEFNFPSATNYSVGLGQNLMKAVWGFSTPLTSRTVLSGSLAYNRGLTARSGQKGINNFEPEVVLVQEFNPRVAGFLDWDTYEDLNFDRYAQLMKGGLTIDLDRKARWVGSPYAQFPLNNFTSRTNIKSNIGFDLSFRY